MDTFFLLLWLQILYHNICISEVFDCTSSNNPCNLQSFTCSGSDSTCTINCGGSGGSCADSTFIIETTSTKTDIAQISCNSKFACNRIQIYSQRAINVECNANSSCNNAYINVTWDDRQNGLSPSIFTIKEPDNSNFKFICSGQGIGVCTLNCGISPTYPNGGVTLCSNGYFDCNLQQASCIWDCIDSSYNYCYNNTLNCIVSDDNTRCYKQNAKNFQVKAIYLTSINPTGSPTAEPTANTSISTPTISPTTSAPHPTYPFFNFAHLVNFTLIMRTTNWTSKEILYTTEGQQVFLKLLNDTKIAIYQHVFRHPNNTHIKIDNIALFNEYSINPGHCAVYDGMDTLPNRTIVFDCELNSDNFTLIQAINSQLSIPSVVSDIDSIISGLVTAFLLDMDHVGPLANVGLLGTDPIELIYDAIIIPGAPTAAPNTPTPTQQDGDGDDGKTTTDAPSLSPTDNPIITTSSTTGDINVTLDDMSTSISSTLVAAKDDNGDTKDNNLMLYILVSVASVFGTFCIVGILLWIWRNMKNTNAHSGQNVNMADLKGKIIVHEKLSSASVAGKNGEQQARESQISHAGSHDIQYLQQQRMAGPGYEVNGDGNIDENTVPLQMGNFDANLMDSGVNMILNNVNAMIADNGNQNNVDMNAPLPPPIPPVKVADFQITPGYDNDIDNIDQEVNNIDYNDYNDDLSGDDNDDNDDDDNDDDDVNENNILPQLNESIDNEIVAELNVYNDDLSGDDEVNKNEGNTRGQAL